MILLDTNVVSELMRRAPDRAVLGWLSSQDSSETTTSAITVAEVEYGLAQLELGRRRMELESIWRALLRPLADRILSFDLAAAHQFGVLAAAGRARGRTLPAVDAQIAAIALVHSATLVTRNVSDFLGTGVAVVNPWAAGV